MELGDHSGVALGALAACGWDGEGGEAEFAGGGEAGAASMLERTMAMKGRGGLR